MSEYFSHERVKAKQFLKDAENEKQEGTQSPWQRESPAKEYLEQVKSSADTDCTPKNDEIRIFCFKKRRLGGTQKHLEGSNKGDGMGFRENTIGFWKSGQR